MYHYLFSLGIKYYHLHAYVALGAYIKICINTMAVVLKCILIGAAEILQTYQVV